MSCLSWKSAYLRVDLIKKNVLTFSWGSFHVRVNKKGHVVNHKPTSVDRFGKSKRRTAIRVELNWLIACV